MEDLAGAVAALVAAASALYITVKAEVSRRVKIVAAAGAAAFAAFAAAVLEAVK